jgi:hypothetical protein
MYKIRIVEASDDDILDTLADLHRSTFFDAAAMPQFELGAWWLAYHGGEAVAFAGVIPSTHIRNGATSRGSACCDGIGSGDFRGLRIERDVIVLNTTDNFIQAGYRLFEPEVPEASAHTLSWRTGLR